MSITRAQIARQLYAKGGNTGYSDFASPSSSTASQDFATQAVSGGQTDYGGGGGSYDYIPQPTVAKKVDTAPKRGSGALTAGSLFSKYLKNFQYATPRGISIDKLRNLAKKTASEKSTIDLLKDVLTDPDKFDPDFKRGSQIKASYPQYVKEGILSAMGFKPTSQIGGGTNAGRALLEKIGSIPGAKTLGRALPGIGTVSGIYDVGSRLSQGDYFGAGLGALSAVPFAGIPAAAAQAAYDYSREKFARGGNTGYSDFASPSSTTASQDFSTQAVSGGQTDYDGGGGGNDQPITEIRPNFNYNIDPSLIDPRLNFKNIAAIIYLQEFLDKQAKGEDVDLEADINYNAPFLGSGLASLAYNTNRGFTAGLSGNLTPNLRGGVSSQDGQQNVNFNYNKGPFSADFTKNPEGYDARFGVNYKFAKGGRIGYQMGGIGAMPMIAETPSDVEGQLSDFDLYSTLEGKEGMRFGENPLRIMEAAQRFSKGGEVRQAYGLGKLVKKITKPIQKVVKSDLGKAALTAAAAYYAPALLGKSGYISGANPLFSATGKGGITDFLIKKGLSAKNYLRNLTGIGLPPGAKSTMSPTKRILTALGIGATASPFFMGGEEEDEETLDQAIARAYGKSDLDIPGIRRAALGYSDPNELYFKLPSAYRLNAAEGGITSMDVDDLPMSKEGSPKYYNPEGEEISFKEFEEAMKKEKQIMPKKKPSRTKKAEGGLMNLGGNEMDLRGGGFVPLGAKEKADDVPARLSKNEFVFTADAVRAAGGGSIEKGAQKMYNTMKQLENMV
jgi:hypothetical protein